MQENTIREIINNFNGDFKSNIPEDVNNFLYDMYESVIGPESSNSFEKQYLDKLEQLDDKLDGSFSQSQRTLYRKIDKIKGEMQNYGEKQAFVYGYCVCELLHKIENASNQ